MPSFEPFVVKQNTEMSDIKISLPKESVSLRDLPPADYVLTQRLADAVEVALALEQPLLITGEPGTGKTRLAHRIAYDLHRDTQGEFDAEPLTFVTQTTSSAQDLFYYYDALSHFHDANLKQSGNQPAPAISNYIELRALGKAIALTNPAQASAYFHTDEEKAQAQKARNSVVLIDEIDKAPRDFPNNLLNQLEQYKFRLKEDGNREIGIAEGRRIVVVLTSNSEKALPEAFLRRCVFFHIPFPDDAQLLRIVKARLGKDSAYANEDLIAHFRSIRDRLNRKPPATAELLAWLCVLELHKFFDKGSKDPSKWTKAQKDLLRLSYPVLAKTQEDLKKLEE